MKTKKTRGASPIGFAKSTPQGVFLLFMDPDATFFKFTI